jgi:spore coat polysaccharide biosynthesis protein SpsF
MRFGIIISARTGSKRLPGKVLLPLLGIPAVAFLIRRIKCSQLAEDITLATTQRSEDDELAEIAAREGVDVFRGPEKDVLARYVQAAAGQKFDYAVRVTGDCPLLDGQIIDYGLKICRKQAEFDLASTLPNFPHGIDFEVYPVSLLERIDKEENLSADDREHVLKYFYRNPARFNIFRLEPPQWLRRADKHFLLDTPSDYQWLQMLLAKASSEYIPVEELINKSRGLIQPEVLDANRSGIS